MDRKKKKTQRRLVVGASVLTVGILIALFAIMNQKVEKQPSIARTAELK